MGWTEIAATFHDCDDDQALRILLVDNRANDLATYDDTALADLLRQLAETDLGLDGTLFDGDALDQLIHDLGREDEIGVDAPETAPAITQLGDIWLLGEHRLMCGDSTVAADLDRLMAGKKANMVFTDPPYGVEYQSNFRTKTKKFDVLINDDTFVDIVPAIQNNSDGWVFVWTSWKVVTVWINNLAALGYPTNIVIWDKGGGGIGDLERTFSTDYEIALVWHRGKNLTGKRIGSVWSIGKDNASAYLHPTQKPVELGVCAISSTTQIGQIVLDLFGGSGSTLIAAHITGRTCYTIELDPHYCDIIAARYQKQTDDLPRLEATGETHNFIPDAD